MEYVVRRVMLALVTIFFMAIVVFLLVRILPGDASLFRLQESGLIKPEQVKALRAEMGLDDFVAVQFVHWFGNVVRGNFGRSFISQQPVVQGLLRGLPVTVQLCLMAWFIALVLGASMGTIAAMNTGKVIDYFARLVAITGLSVPDFLAATLFILFTSLFLHWAPPIGFVPFFVSPFSNLQQIGPAALVLGFHLSGVIMRLTRSSLLEVKRQDYIRTARAKGLSEKVVLLRHEMRNAMIPVITVSGTQLGRLLGGSIILETVFALPGVGSWIINGITYRDHPVVQTGSLFIACVMVTMNLTVDLIIQKVDPRVRY